MTSTLGDTKSVFSVTDYAVSKEKFNLHYDHDREMFVTQPKPQLDRLGAYYESEDYISHTDSQKTFVDKVYQFVKSYMLSRKLKIVDSYSLGKKLLDIGAGTGDFLKTANQGGYLGSGVEPNENARNTAKSKKIELYEELPTDKLNYDVITMWHVLEHVYHLDKQVNWLKNNLSKDGVIIIAVPNYKSYDAKIYKHFWAGYDVPRHLYHFSQQSISAIFESYDFKVIKTLPMYFDSFYVSLLSEKYRGKNLKYLRAACVGFVSNLKAMFTGEYSSLIYVIKHK